MSTPHNTFPIEKQYSYLETYCPKMFAWPSGDWKPRNPSPVIPLHPQKDKESKASPTKSAIRWIITTFESTSHGKAGFKRSRIQWLCPSIKCENAEILAKLAWWKKLQTCFFRRVKKKNLYMIYFVVPCQIYSFFAQPL